MNRLIAPILLIAGATPLAAQQDAATILRTMEQRREARWAGVTDYALEQLVEGAAMSAPLYFERASADGRITFRAVPVNEWAKEAAGTEAIGAREFDAYADAQDSLGAAFVREMGPTGRVFQSMTDRMAAFLRAGAAAERSGAAYGDENMDAPNVAGFAELAPRLTLEGSEAVDGRDAFRLRAADLANLTLPQAASGSPFQPEAVTLWIDQEEYVPLRMVMEGRMSAGGQEVPIRMEILQLDYRQEGPLYEPTRLVMRMDGLVEAMAADPARRRDLAEARRAAADAEREMARMKEELARLPGGMQDMIRGQMEKGLERLNLMLEEGRIEAVVLSRVLSVNQGPPVEWRPTLVGDVPPP